MPNFARCSPLLLLLLSTPLPAQFAQRASITGTVTDPSGAVVPNAGVTLVDTDQKTDSTTRTNDNGQYTFTQLNIGHYQVIVDQPGFEKQRSNVIELAAQQNARLDFSLTPGNVQTEVEVTSAEPLIELDRASVDETINFQQIQALPINGRNFTSLAALAPAVATTPLANVNTGGTYNAGTNHVTGGTQYAVGGQFEGVPPDNGYYINGVNTNENYQGSISYAPSPDAAQEMRIAVSDFGAASGHDVSTFTLSTRAGTNKFHGQGYDYVENDILNAGNPNDEANGLFSKPTLRRNQFGGGLGGPVLIPGLRSKLKDRAFFYANFEQWEERDGLPNTTALVPSAAERSGNFAELCTGGFNSAGICSNPLQQLYDPYSTTYDASGMSHRTPLPFNRLPANEIDPKAAAVLNLYPAANTPNVNGFNYVTSANHAASTYRFDSRFDYRLGDKNTVFVTYSQSRGTDNNSGGVFPQFPSDLDDRSRLVTVNDAHIFTPTLTNEFIFGWSRASLLTAPSSELSFLNSAQNPLNEVFGNTGSGLNRGVMLLNVANYTSIGYGEIFQAAPTSTQFSDNVTWVHGVHNFTFGGNFFNKGEEDWDFNRFVSFGCALNYIQGSCPFQPFTGAGTADNSVGGDSVADLLLGLPRNIHQRYNITGSSPTAPELDVRFPYWGFYANDRMQLGKLTVSLGLRYDLVIPIYARNNLCCALVNESVPGWELQVPGIAPGVPQHFLSARKTNFAPRVSAAYQLTNKLVLRAGYGMFYDAGAGQISGSVGNALSGIAGYFVGYELNNSSVGAQYDTPALHLSDVFPAAPNVAPATYPVSTGKGTGLLGTGGFNNVYTFDNQSSIVPRYHRYLADVQYQIAAQTVVTLEYLGAQGSDGQYFQGENLPPYQLGWTSIDAFNAARPNNTGNFGTVYVLHPGLRTHYNAGVVKVDKRMSHGFLITSSYTWSNTIANRASVPGGSNVWAYSLNGSEGPATLDHPQRFVFSPIWQPQYGANWKGVLKSVLTGWQISAITTLESGNRYSALNYTGTSANDFNGPDLMSIKSGANPNVGHFDKSFNQQFNANAFYVPDNNTHGNAQPGLIQGPGQLNTDFALAKTFSLNERFKLDFRSDFFNGFNHPQWTGIVNGYSPNPGGPVLFGRASGAREGRIVQMSAKVHF